MRVHLLTFLPVVCVGVGTPTPNAYGQEDEPPVAPALEGQDEEQVQQERRKGEELRIPRRRGREAQRFPEGADGRGWLARTNDKVKDWFEQHNIHYDLNAALFYQHADVITEGQNGAWTLSWQLDATWRLFRSEQLGSGAIGTTLLGTVGLNYDARVESLDDFAGIASGLNGTLYPDPFIVDQLYWEQVVLDDALVLMGGIVDLSQWFDTNRVANDGFSDMIATGLENNLTIPFTLVGGVGAVARWQASDSVYLMGGISDSIADVPNEPWRSLRGDSIYTLFELGLTLDFEGVGTGIYRFIPWYSSLRGDTGGGFGVSFDQELWSEDLIGFFRFGVGRQNVSLFGTFVSGGLGYTGLFGRPADMVGAGVAWSDPGPLLDARPETVFELFYRVEIVPNAEITPDLQLVLDPVFNPDSNLTWVLGLRLALHF